MRKYSLTAGLLITVASIIAIASAWHDSPIVDEIPHIGAGYSYIAGQTHQFNPEHPPLAKDLAGLGLIPLHINSNIIPIAPANVNDQWNFGRTLIYHSNADPIAIVHSAKLPLILLFILSAMLVFLWAKKVYNPRAALLAVFLFSFSPTIIAHSRLVTTDIAALFGVLFSTYFFVRYLQEQSTFNFWLASLSFGVALLTKFSTFLLIPYFLLVAIIWSWTHHNNFFRPIGRLLLKSILIMAIGFIIIVGPIYQLHVLNYPPAQQKKDTATILRYYPISTFSDAIIWASDKPILRPYAQWGLGLAMVFQRAEGGNRTYFLGQLSSTSFKSYFPIVFGLKEPIPFLILLLCSVWLGFKSWRKVNGQFKEKIKERLPEFVMLLWIFIYMTASIKANLNIGIRHLMPIYGFIFVLVAGQIESIINLKNIKKWFTVFVSILCLWYIGEFASVYPSYLSYFNEFSLIRPAWAPNGQAGGQNYVVDSNFDWGQDLWRLGDFVKQNNIQKIYLDYFGWAEQSFYLGNSFQWIHAGQYPNKAQFLGDNPSGGWLAVSVSYYQESTVDPAKPYGWLGQPTVVIGDSIFVWHVTQ